MCVLPWNNPPFSLLFSLARSFALSLSLLRPTVCSFYLMFTLAAREGISIRVPASFSRTALTLRPKRTRLREVLQLQLLCLPSCRAVDFNRACLCPRVWRVRAETHF